MAKPVGHRRPRKEVPNDLVSCPPALNLKKSSGKRTKQFVNELVEMSPQLSTDNQQQEDVSALGLASLMQSTVSSLETPQFPASFKQKHSGKEAKERNMRNFKTQRRAPPRPGGDSPPPPHSRSEFASQRPRTAANNTRKHHEEAGVPVTRPRNYRGRRSSSVYSSVQSSMASSMLSWESMSQSAFSVYTTASVIARRPAWGHYVVGVLVFLGWVLHHYYFSEYFQPLYANTIQQALVKDLILDVSPNSNNNPSMLRGAMQESAVYLHQDYEKRDDYDAVKPVNAAFDTIVGEEKIRKSNAFPNLEEEADAEADSGGPVAAWKLDEKKTAGENQDDKCKDGATGTNCTKT